MNSSENPNDESKYELEERYRLTDLQRLMLVNQYLILEQVDPHEKKSYSQHREALENGYELHYPGMYTHILEPLSIKDSLFILEVLNLYSSIYFSLENEVEFDHNSQYRFKGFDLNEEPSFVTYAEYFVNELGRFSTLKYGAESAQFNSHGFQPDYETVLNRWKKISRKRMMTREQIDEIISNKASI